ncbi:hypothetical protein TUBRATIS_28910 [Tubulinosema ratisbonensis]|uniref:Uncharacterized protein n=1 Tax=Tubulinosema ratisbonensis TaxID=291195 RepID=A0A437AI03_9MICR|nr:hypothetical protein TUBRATIS_28910 [Tubulinosema ratisbonensis]
MHKKQKATRLLNLDEVSELRKLGLIFKTIPSIDQNIPNVLYKDTESDFCRKLKIHNNDFTKYKEKYFEKGEKGLRSILVRHGFRKEKSDLVVNYLVKKNKIE